MPAAERPGPASAPGPGIADRARLFAILSGTWLAQSCYALAKLGIADQMAAGTRVVADLARATRTDQRALDRLLRALCSVGLVTQVDTECFELTALGQPLRSGVPRSSHDAAVMFGEEVFRSFAGISYTLQTGKPAFEKVYGKPFYDYVLSRILHNWDDDDVARLLGRVREAVSPEGRLIVFEQFIEPAGAAPDLRADQPAHVIDLLILLMLAGRDRTLEECSSLLGRSGFEVTAVRPGPLRARQAEGVIEAVPR